jgi:hypothetical protein
VVAHAKLPWIGALALLSAALVMVLVLAGGLEPSSSSSPELTAGNTGLNFSSSTPDDAQIGSDRTVLQISARRAGAAGMATAVPDAGRIAPAVGAVTLLLLAVRLGPVPQLNRPSLRGPPPA